MTQALIIFNLFNSNLWFFFKRTNIVFSNLLLITITIIFNFTLQIKSMFFFSIVIIFFKTLLIIMKLIKLIIILKISGSSCNQIYEIFFLIVIILIIIIFIILTPRSANPLYWVCWCWTIMKRIKIRTIKITIIVFNFILQIKSMVLFQ